MIVVQILCSKNIGSPVDIAIVFLCTISLENHVFSQSVFVRSVFAESRINGLDEDMVTVRDPCKHTALYFWKDL